MASREVNIAKNASNDRILVLAPIEGAPTLNSKGVVDKRLFTGENKLHAKLDPHFMLWSVQYDHGIPPQPFQQRFTSFTKLYDFVKDYYLRRNIQIVKVID